MIEINNKRIICIVSKLKKVSEVWANNSLITLSSETIDDIISCFSKGYWLGEKPWIGSLGWKGN